MTKTKKAKSITYQSVQIKLSTKRLFDAYLIFAISNYKASKKNVTGLFRSLLDEAIEKKIDYPEFSVLDFEQANSFNSFRANFLQNLEDMRVVIRITDKKQNDFLNEIDKKMFITDFSKYLFLNYFYNSSDTVERVEDKRKKVVTPNKPVSRLENALKNEESEREILEIEEKVDAPVKKNIIQPKAYVQKQGKRGKSDWIF
jgi:hypothetical protein